MSRRWRALAFVVPPLAALAWVLFPVVRGSETFFLRDLFTVHLELRHAVAAGLAQGRLPLVDPLRLGQPLAGNPNAVAFYPTVLLHLVAPLVWALDAHLWLHLFAAPFAAAWLGRELGLGRRGAWAAGVCYGFSGFLVSQLTFFNLIAGVALAPALAAATAGAARRARHGGAAAAYAAAAGLLWTLLLLGGDPMTAALAAAVAGAVALPRLLGAGGGAPGTRRLAWGLLAVAALAGTLVALPQIVEFLRILPSSARGHLGFQPGVRTAGSLDPRQAIGWLLPFPFGRPDRLGPGSYWGYPFHQGSWAFYYSLYPGLGALALLAAAGLPRRRGGVSRGLLLTGWGLAAAGAFFALGAFNPVAAWLLELPGLAVLRYPSKFWLPAAVGLALLCGLGFERALVSREPASRRRAFAALALAAAALALSAAVLRLAPQAAAAGFAAWMPRDTPASMAAAEVIRWSGLCRSSLVVAAALALALWWSGRRPAAGGALLLTLHAATQLFFLHPAMPTDAVLPYRLPSRLLQAVPPDAVVVQGVAQGLFGPAAVSDAVFPEPAARWIYRRAAAELYPLGGTLWNRRYDLVTSPEALDPLPLRRAFSAVENAGDRQRLRLLAAWGVDRLILNRRLEDSDLAGLAAPAAGAQSFRKEVWVYRLTAPAPPVYLATRVLTAPRQQAVAARSPPPPSAPVATSCWSGRAPTAAAAAPGGCRTSAWRTSR